MTQLASVGDFCPNPDCPVYGNTEANAIIRHGKTRQGRQRFQCKVCKKTFNERHGTLFYNRKTDEKDILECLALLAEGVRISSISRSKGIKEDAILSFLREAACVWEDVVYNLARLVKTLRREIDSEGKRWLPVSPAMAAGLTDHIWAIRDLLMLTPLPINSI